MVWIVIAVVLIAAVGPIFWLLPSKANRRLAELRTAARQTGLVVEIATVPKLDATPEERVSAGGVARDATVDCAVYRLPLTRRLTHAPRWMLLKSASEHRDLDGWTTLVPPVAVPSERAVYWREIETIVNAFPGGCIAVEAQAQIVGWYGRERIEGASVEETVDAIRDGLRALAALHQRVDHEARAGGAKA